MNKMIRVQIDNSLRYNVHLVVIENEAYLEIMDRFAKTLRQIPVARRKIKANVNFYRSQWLYRLWSRLPYGHINIEFSDGTFLNLDLKTEECGLISSYQLKPDYVIETTIELDNLSKAVDATKKPLSLWSIFSHNCLTVACLALFGSKDLTKLRELYKNKSEDYSSASEGVRKEWSAERENV